MDTIQEKTKITDLVAALKEERQSSCLFVIEMTQQGEHLSLQFALNKDEEIRVDTVIIALNHVISSLITESKAAAAPKEETSEEGDLDAAVVTAE